MKKIFQTIFPYRLYIHIFQLERYDLSRTLHWIFSYFLKRSTQNKKPLVVTWKVKMIRALSILIAGILFIAVALVWNIYATILITLLVLIQPYILISLSIMLLKPYERWNRAKTIRETQKKISNLKKTKIIGIAGSYGKTSVKDILYHLLFAKYQVLKTPLSYNTIFGIAQVVDLELDDSYDFFICELGEFQRGDIIEMCEMVQPSFGIMTGINDQHLERFKHIENTIATVFELYDYLKAKGQHTVANLTNEYIANKIERWSVQDSIVSYGVVDSTVSASSISFSDAGTIFDVTIGDIKKKIMTPLLGTAHVNNMLGAATLAYELGVSPELIVERLKTVPKVSHRFEQALLSNGYLLVDNSYSSNSDGFKEALLILKGLPRKHKVLVTPGMVELGNDSGPIHVRLGELAKDVCTKLVLVGDSERTRSLEKGMGVEKTVYLDDIRKLWEIVSTFGFDPKDTVILLENDLPDNY